jgi:transposase
MRRLEIQDAEIMRIAVQQEIVRSEESRYDHRLHGILLILDGYSPTEVAELFGQSRRTVQYWINRFEKSGFAGLADTPRPGRSTALDADQIQSVGRDLRQSPRGFGYEQNLWDGKLLSHHLQARYRVRMGVRQCQRLFHRLGFRQRKPRPLIAHGDPQAQETYKKTRRTRSRGRN